jgi:uncharacterized membrane protein YbaN (DUF454 family)
MTTLRRGAYVVIGLASVGLAVLGALLPGLPTTVFLLVALWAFSRSSDRMHRWVRQAPVFREAMTHVDRYHEERTIGRGVKIVAVSCAWTSVALFFLSNGVSVSLTAIVLVILAMACTVFMTLTRTAARTEKLEVRS